MPEMSQITDTTGIQREGTSTLTVADIIRTEEEQVKLDSDPGPKSPAKYMETEAAYDLWAEARIYAPVLYITLILFHSGVRHGW
jgi:hypothetical protein